MAFYAVAPAYAQQNRTLKSEMEVIHESLGVNFVYDSAIEINVSYSGKPMKDIIKGNKKEHSVLLDKLALTRGRVPLIYNICLAKPGIYLTDRYN